MTLPKVVTPRHIIVLLILFWAMWLYTEVDEGLKRKRFNQEVKEFMHRGDRFTRQEGDELKARVRQLEKQIAVLQNEYDKGRIRVEKLAE